MFRLVLFKLKLFAIHIKTTLFYIFCFFRTFTLGNKGNFPVASSTAFNAAEKQKKASKSSKLLMSTKLTKIEQMRNKYEMILKCSQEVGQLLDSALLMECLVGDPPRVLLSPSLTKCLVRLST